MAITLHRDIEQGSPEWLAARDGKFTGSNAYKLLSSFGAGDHAKSETSDFTGNFYTKRGHLLEDEALEVYEAVTKDSVEHCGFVTNDRFPSCLYSPDGLTASHVIEVKCFGNKPHLAIWEGDIPLKILAQIHFGMLVCERQAARLVIYNPKLPPAQAFKYIEIANDPRIAQRFLNILEGGLHAIT